MSEDVPVYRHWLLLRTLGARRYGLTVREMAHEMGVADKTIRRDLTLFQRLGFPLLETNGKRGRKTWRLGAGGSAPPLHFTFDEAVVLYPARPFLEPLAGTQLWQDALRTRSVSLSSERLGITGKLDLLEEQGDAIRPVETKCSAAPRDEDGQPSFWENDDVQLCAQALLVEESMAVTVNGKGTQRVPIVSVR